MSSAQCLQCASPVATVSDRFCTYCGTALSSDEQIAEGRGGTTGGLGFACPDCRELNPASRLLCQRCGALLEPAQAPLPASLAAGAPWRWRAPLILLAIAAVAAVIAMVLAASLRSDGLLSPSTSSAATAGRAAATAAPVKLNPRSISAEASSELPPAGRVTYSIGNTLDGDTRTAWNSHGAVDGNGVGETLTYRFPRPVHLVRVALVNGYAKTSALRADNGRIRRIVIRTDHRTVKATLADSTSRQRLDRDFGMTRQITLRVTAVYPGARYADLALTEIAFWAAPR